MSKKYLHIYRPIGTTTIIVEYEKKEVDKCPSLEELQELVGGLIEPVDVKYNGKWCTMLVNEEGLLMNLTFNSAATRLMKDSYGEGYIVGPAVILDGVDLK